MSPRGDRGGRRCSSSSPAEPLLDNAYKVPLLRELIVSTLGELTEVTR
ncbi:MAG: hypothetical protein WKF76_07765 [Nocardioidaceae bacterium]